MMNGANYKHHKEVERHPLRFQPRDLENVLCGGVASDLIRNEVGTNGEKMVESSSQYMQTNLNRYFPNPRYYFQVNDRYVRNKLMLIVFPFFHKEHRTRLSEPIVAGELPYKSSLHDINAPDLYIPLMAFGTYLLLAGLSLGLHGKFSPTALHVQFRKGLVGWLMQVIVLKVILVMLGRGDVPLLDMVAYGGYAFTGISLAMLAKILWSRSFYFVIAWECFCMAVLLVKILKRVIFTEARKYNHHSSHRQHHYYLLLVALFQIPLFFWLSNINA